MSASCIRNLGQWVVAPLAAVTIAYVLSFRQSDQLPIDTPPPSAQEKISAAKSAMSSWQHARKLADPLLRIQASWAAIEETDEPRQEELFRRALEEEDHEGLAMLGETWLARDAIGFIEALSDLMIWASSPPVFQMQMDRAFRFWMNADPKKAFQAFLKLDHQSQLILGSSNRRTLAGELLLSYLSKEPAAVKDIDLKTFASGMSNHGNSAKFSGDVEALAHGLSQRSLDDVHTKGLLAFFQRAIRTNDPTDETNRRFLTWWRALPEAMQLQTIPWVPWDASPEILHHPGLQKRLAQRAMDDLSQVPVYLAHYGNAWAAENPKEALEWVLERYRDQALTGPPWPLTPDRLPVMRMNFNNVGHDSEAFSEAVSIPIRAMVANHPRQAVEAMEALPYPHTRSKVAIVIAQEWVKSDPEAALEWSETLPGTYARKRARDIIEGKDQGNGFYMGSFDLSP